MELTYRLYDLQIEVGFKGERRRKEREEPTQGPSSWVSVPATLEDKLWKGKKYMCCFSAQMCGNRLGEVKSECQTGFI